MNILVTRPEHQAETLCQLIEQQGWNAIRFPTLKIVAADNNKIRQQLATLDQYHWIIFISANAVNFALSANDGKIEGLSSASAIAVVGKATAKALYSAGLPVDLLPEFDFNSEGLLATEQMQHVNGKSCLIIRGKGGREILANSLRERGAIVEYMEVYTREIPVCNSTNVVDMLQQGQLDAITVTSGNALDNLLAMISDKLHDKLKSIPLIVISDRIKALAEQHKFKHIAVTGKPGDAAIIETAMMSLGTQ